MQAQPVPRPHTGLSLRDRNVSNAEAPRDCSGYLPRERRKCSRGCSREAVSLWEDEDCSTALVEKCGGAGLGVDSGKDCCGCGGMERERAFGSIRQPVGDASYVGNGDWTATAAWRVRARARLEAMCISEWVRPARIEGTKSARPSRTTETRARRGQRGVPRRTRHQLRWRREVAAHQCDGPARWTERVRARAEQGRQVARERGRDLAQAVALRREIRASITSGKPKRWSTGEKRKRRRNSRQRSAGASARKRNPRARCERRLRRPWGSCPRSRLSSRSA
eukprot:3953571-Pleurochrysis_carterae.AAC.1